MGLKNFEWKELDRCPADEGMAREEELISKFTAQSIEVLNKSHTRGPKQPVGVIEKSRVKNKIAAQRSWENSSAKKWRQLSGKLLPCINLDTGERFQSLLEAERKGPDARSGIKKSCETGRPTIKGNRYAYIDIEGRPIFKEGHNKELPRTRRVKDVNTGKIFTDISAAAKHNGISRNMIQTCCTGKYETAGGRVFCYIGDNGEEILTETHIKYFSQVEERANRAFAAWKIDDVERKDLVIADTPKKLSELLEINRSHILAVCRGERQHVHGWRIAFYNKATRQLDLKKAHCEKIRKQSRQVICLNDNEIYSCFSEAAKHYGLISSSIKWCCDGILKSTNRKGPMRYRFAYVDASGRPLLTPKHAEPLETLGDIRLLNTVTGEKYQSVAHCSRETGIPQKRIRRYLRDSSVDLAGCVLIPLDSPGATVTANHNREV